ncbi:ionotropic receptor 92a [Musca autumnalis]|uniref:ionotropic receptor 92a n=1 Tax=Musca autumnalis TaxID=221902 RepID=UPI003CEDC5A3
MLLQPALATTSTLIQFLITSYFTNITSVLIVYDGDAAIKGKHSLQYDYMEAVQQAFHNQSQHGIIIALQWINVKYFKDMRKYENEDDYADQEFKETMLKTVNMVTEGFITILRNTSSFLHARYYATRYTTLRLKDKIYLFLCEKENPTEFLASEVLQFYPHHLMVTPSSEPEQDLANGNKSNVNGRHKDNNCNEPTMMEEKQQQTSRISTKQTCDNHNENFTLLLENISMKATREFASHSSSVNATSLANQKAENINFELWTQKYVGAEGNLDAILLDTFQAGNMAFAKNVELYPNKLQNMQQRVMRVSSLTYLPYVKTDYVSPGKGNVDEIDSKAPKKTMLFQGSEADLLRIFCEIKNCSIRLQAYGPDFWGSIWDNGSSEGSVSDIYEQRTEVVIGCIYNWYPDLWETSQFIAKSAITVMGPGPTQYARWRTNIMPFSTGLWICLFPTLIMCSLTFHFVKYTAWRCMKRRPSKKADGLKSYEKAMLEVFAVFIQQPSVDTVLKRNASRVFLAFLLCATITLENTYSGQLKSILTMPLFNDPIDTVEKWSKTDWKWAAPSIVWIGTINKSNISKEQSLAAKFEIRDHDYMYNASFRNDYGLGVERLYSGYLNVGKYITMPAVETKVIFKDDLYVDWTHAAAIRGWPIMPVLDEHILLCLQSGIYLYWERLANYRFMDGKLQEVLVKIAYNRKHKSPPQRLSIDHISGPLFILLFGYLTAFVVFLIETFTNRLQQRIQKN